jgi:hypothetical protein
MLVILAIGYGLYKWSKKSYNTDCTTYLRKLNMKLLKYGIKWERSACRGFLHLCTDYPKHYEPQGKWKVIADAWKWAVFDAIMKYVKLA